MKIVPCFLRNYLYHCIMIKSNFLKCYTIKISILLFLISSVSSAQLNDLVRIDYTIIPDRNADDMEFSRFRALVNFPVKLKKEGNFLLLGLDYSNINLRVRDNSLPFDSESLNDFKVLDINIGFTKPLKNDWRLGVRFRPGFSTNLTANQIRFDDIVFSGDLVFIKEKIFENGKKTRIIFGITYAENRGFPYPLPFISYYKKFHLNWSYNIGVPKSNLQYHLSTKHRFKIYAALDGFTSNLQDGVVLNDIGLAETINTSIILGGLQYEYHFIDHFEFFIRAAYNLSISTNLRDQNNNNILSLENESQVYFRTGLRFKI